MARRVKFPLIHAAHVANPGLAAMMTTELLINYYEASHQGDKWRFEVVDKVLLKSSPLNYDGMTMTGRDEAKAILDRDGNVTLTGGTDAVNATDKALTRYGIVKLDNKTLIPAEAVEVTATVDALKGVRLI